MSGSSSSITLGGARVYLDVPARSKAFGLANSIFSPVGPAPTRGWFVMLKSGVDALGTSSTTSVVWDQTGEGAKSLTFAGLYLVNSERLRTGGVGDANALYLVELADARYILDKTTDTGAIIKNIRSYANSQDYLTGTSGGTWATLVEALWDACGLLGDFPGLPFTPDGVPENTWLIGLNAWRALNAVLDQLDCGIAYRLDGTYVIVQLGGNQTVTEETGSLVWDGEPGQYNARVAATVRVYYHFHRKSYGQERDTELENNWAYNGAGAWNDLPTSVTGATGRKPLWDDLRLVLDENNQATNTAAITTRAEARRDRYVLRNTVETIHRIHRGLSDNWLPGEQIRATLWKNLGPQEGGTLTEFICKSDLVVGFKTEAYGTAWMDAELGAPEREQYLSLDLGRPTYPNYPRLPNIVQVHHSSEQAGADVDANDDGLHPGRVARWVDGAMAHLDNCWIGFVDDFDNNEGDVQAVQDEYYGPARLCGMITSGGTQLPLYLVRKGGGESSPIVVFQITANFGHLGQASAKICTLVGGVWAANGAAIVVTGGYSQNGVGLWAGQGQGLQPSIGARGLAFRRDDNKYEIIFMQMRDGVAAFTVGESAGVSQPLIGDIPGEIDYSYQQGSLGFEPGTIDVDDVNSIYPRALPGGRGIADFDYVLNKYRVTVCQQMSFSAIAFLKNALKRSDLVATIELFTPTGFSPFNLAPPQLPTQAYNRYDLRGDVGDRVHLFWNELAAPIGGGGGPPGAWDILVTITDDAVFRGKTTAAHAKGATQTVRRWETVNGVDTDTGLDYSVTNLGTAIGGNKTVWFTRIGDAYELISVECPPE